MATTVGSHHCVPGPRTTKSTRETDMREDETRWMAAVIELMALVTALLFAYVQAS